MGRWLLYTKCTTEVLLHRAANDWVSRVNITHCHLDSWGHRSAHVNCASHSRGGSQPVSFFICFIFGNLNGQKMTKAQYLCSTLGYPGIHQVSLSTVSKFYLSSQGNPRRWQGATSHLPPIVLVDILRKWSHCLPPPASSATIGQPSRQFVLSCGRPNVSGRRRRLGYESRRLPWGKTSICHNLPISGVSWHLGFHNQTVDEIERRSSLQHATHTMLNFHGASWAAGR